MTDKKTLRDEFEEWLKATDAAGEMAPDLRRATVAVEGVKDVSCYASNVTQDTFTAWLGGYQKGLESMMEARGDE